MPRHLTYPIQENIEEIMYVQTSAVPGATPRPPQFQGAVLEQRPTPHCHISKLTPPIEVFLIIFGSSHHELRIIHGFTRMTRSLHGWEAFPTPRALTHTKITWALLSKALQVPDITPGSPLCPWYCEHSIWRDARQIQTKLGEDKAFTN